MPVGISSPSAKTVDLSDFPSPSGVFQNQNLVRRRLADFDHRIRFAAGHPQASLRIKVDLNRLVQLWVFGPQRDFQVLVPS